MLTFIFVSNQWLPNTQVNTGYFQIIENILVTQEHSGKLRKTLNSKANYFIDLSNIYVI